jgi:hypothetical protein
VLRREQGEEEAERKCRRDSRRKRQDIHGRSFNRANADPNILERAVSDRRVARPDPPRCVGTKVHRGGP